MNNEMALCKGVRCAMRESCKRYINNNMIGDGVEWFFCCDPHTREGYVSINK